MNPVLISNRSVNTVITGDPPPLQLTQRASYHPGFPCFLDLKPERYPKPTIIWLSLDFISSDPYHLFDGSADRSLLRSALTRD